MTGPLTGGNTILTAAVMGTANTCESQSYLA
jgi:hypothetical protein